MSVWEVMINPYAETGAEAGRYVFPGLRYAQRLEELLNFGGNQRGCDQIWTHPSGHNTSEYICVYSLGHSVTFQPVMGLY